jgi:hypothetical protein
LACFLGKVFGYNSACKGDVRGKRGEDETDELEWEIVLRVKVGGCGVRHVAGVEREVSAESVLREDLLGCIRMLDLRVDV